MKNITLITDTYPDIELLYASGEMGFDLDEAIIGVEPFLEKLIYSTGKCIEVIERDMIESDKEAGEFDLERDYHLEAIEWFEYNVRGAYMGEHTPIFIDDEIVPRGEKIVKSYAKYYNGFLLGVLTTSIIWTITLVILSII